MFNFSSFFLELIESHKCRQEGINIVGFLDPSTVNEKTINLPATVGYLYNAFLATLDKRCILLSYKCY